jgi:polar amino acid transport system substrate-binding protein
MKKFYLGIIVGLLSFMLAGSCYTKEIRMVAPIIPPHFDEVGAGRIGDIISTVMKRCGHSVTYLMVPFGRHWSDYKNHDIDGLATAESDQVFPGYSTKPFIHLQDGATVIDGNGLENAISINDFTGKRIIGFPNAQEILDIEHLIPTFARFTNQAKRFEQVRPLLAGRADAIFADGLITAHFLELVRKRGLVGLEPDVDSTIKTKFRRIFTMGPQRLYFRDKTLTADFERCHQELEATGELDRIAQPYVEKYRSVLDDQYPLR